MTVNQAREAYPPSRGGGSGYDKALVPLDAKLKERNLHYLQVSTSVCVCVRFWLWMRDTFTTFKCKTLITHKNLYAFSQFL